MPVLVGNIEASYPTALQNKWAYTRRPQALLWPFMFCSVHLDLISQQYTGTVGGIISKSQAGKGLVLDHVVRT